MVDLRNCKPGDKLLSKHGMILTYVQSNDQYDNYKHLVKYPNGSHGSRTDTGHVMMNENSRLESDHDIVEILK